MNRATVAVMLVLFVAASCAPSSNTSTQPAVTLQTWTFDGTTWTSSPGPPTAARQSPAMAYDPQNRDVVMFGGINQTDTWTWEGRVWRRQHPRISPLGTVVGTMFYDDALRVVVFVDEKIRVWAWDGNDWTRIAEQGAPPPRLSGGTHISAGYDPEVGGFVVLANNWTTSPPQSTYDTWSWNGSVWTLLGEQRLTLNRGPDSDNGELVFDPGSGRFVSVGNGSSSATWTWSGNSWVGAPQPFGAGGPAVYDPALGGIVTVTLCTTAALCGTSEATWLDRSGEWTVIDVQSPKHPTDVEGMTFDGARDQLVLVGCSTLVCGPA